MRSVNYVLTTAKLNAEKPGDKPRKVADGGGLFVRIAPAGTKAWAYAYSYRGKAREVGLGTFPEVSIKAARDLHFAARQALAEDRDPAAEKREKKRRDRDGDMSFESVSTRWLDAKRAKCRPRTIARIDGMLRRDIWPGLGKMQLDTIKPRHVLDVIKAKAAYAPASASMVREIIKDIFDTAICNLVVEVNPVTPLKRDKIITLPPTKHHRHLTEEQLGVWWEALAACEGPTHASTINAARFVALTLCRKSEVIFATWGEIEDLDGDDPRFVVPAARMKMNREHVIPLPRQAVEVLRAQAALAKAAGRKCAPDEFIFTKLNSKKHFDVNTLNFLFARIAEREGCEFIRGEDGTGTFPPHGLRSTATSILIERGYPLAVVDLLLAHSQRGVIASYNRAEQLPARRAALQFYADLIDSLVAAARGDNVVMLKRKAA